MLLSMSDSLKISESYVTLYTTANNIKLLKLKIIYIYNIYNIVYNILALWW